ncbi:MAG TPA: glycine cleavage T C-terminal barrel domain-containing protein [Solirubrobacteraceae bacterium]|jgi:folate-binding protein YgfZ|nr:glycine cleavage T C-terminal barrel domain-containing protein [Solirubrobacteraceae bacterium]
MAATQTDLPGAEQRALRDGCALLDRSERGKLALTGAGAVEFLNGQVTNELADLRPGEGRYAAFLTPKGKMLGDLRILAVGSPGAEADAPPVELLLDTERSSLQALFDMIRRYKVGYDVELHKRTVERGLLSLIGPESERVAGVASPLAAASGIEPEESVWLLSTEHANTPVSRRGVDALAIRTDVGVDLLCDAADSERLTAALVERGAVAVSESAAEILRVESGRPRFGLDMDDTTIPQEAALNERAVNFTKGCYVGQETVARLHYRGKPNRHLRGLRLSAPAATGDELHLGERVVGRVGSSVISPGLGPIALALVRREAEPGVTVAVGEHGVTAVVVELPFHTC